MANSSEQGEENAGAVPVSASPPGSDPPARPLLQRGVTPSASSAFTAVRPSNAGQAIPIRPPTETSPSAPQSAPAQAGGDPAQSKNEQDGTPGAPSATPPPRRNTGNSRRSNGVPPGGKKFCNCKNSRCLKLYCECFASGRYCDNCNCLSCANTAEFELIRQQAVETILERNPSAFRPKIQGANEDGIAAAPTAGRHNKGCNCKKSGCLKKYCECFQAGIFCATGICKCVECKNFDGSDAREVVLRVGTNAAALAVKRAHESQAAGLVSADLSHLSGPPANRRRLTPLGPMNGHLPDAPPAVSNGHAPARALPLPATAYNPVPMSAQNGHATYSAPSTNGMYSGQDMSHMVHADAQGPLRILQDYMRELLKNGGVEGLLSVLLLATQAEEREAVRQAQAQEVARQSQAQAHAQALMEQTSQSSMIAHLLQSTPPGEDFSQLYEAKERVVIYEQLEVMKKILDRLTGNHQYPPQQQQQMPMPRAPYNPPQVDMLMSHLGQPYASSHAARGPPGGYSAPVPDAQLAAQMQYIQRQQGSMQAQAQSHGQAAQCNGPPPGTYPMSSGYGQLPSRPPTSSYGQAPPASRPVQPTYPPIVETGAFTANSLQSLTNTVAAIHQAVNHQHHQQQHHHQQQQHHHQQQQQQQQMYNAAHQPQSRGVHGPPPNPPPQAVAHPEPKVEARNY